MKNIRTLAAFAVIVLLFAAAVESRLRTRRYERRLPLKRTSICVAFLSLSAYLCGIYPVVPLALRFQLSSLAHPAC